MILRCLIYKLLIFAILSLSSAFSKDTSRDDFHLTYQSSKYNFWIKYFTKRKHQLFERHLKNGDKYYHTVRSILKKEGLPTDLFYLALIESGFNSGIKSRASAVGYWQFIKGTGTRYGLRVDKWLDERKNIVKSTKAAAHYLADLYNIFGSWELALCAYNAGEYRVINAIRKGNTRDYKKLISKRLLPKETAYYIAKIVAARTLDRNRRKYKFPLAKRKRNLFDHSHLAQVTRSFNLSQYSKKKGYNYKELRRLNPDIKTGWIKVRRKRRPFKFIVPGGAKAFHVSKRLKSYGRRISSVDKSKKYIVKRGDRLSNIARKFGVTLRKIKKVNNLKGSRILVGQRLKIPGKKHQVYTIKNGDSLTKVSKLFGVKIKDIKKVNRLSSSRIYPKQRLLIP